MSSVSLFSLVTVTALVWSSLWTEDGTKAVQELLNRQVADWNQHDLDSFLNSYWHSPELVFQTGADRVEGWDALRERYHRNYQSEGKEMGKLAFDGVEIIPLSNSSALARGRWQLTMDDGSKPGGVFTLIVRREPEGWRIVHDHTSGK